MGKEGKGGKPKATGPDTIPPEAMQMMLNMQEQNMKQMKEMQAMLMKFRGMEVTGGEPKPEERKIGSR